MGGRRAARHGGRLGRDGRKRGLCAALQAEVETEVERLIGAGSVDALDFEAVETALRARVLRLAARALETRLNADRSDHAGPSLPCACGAPARYAGRRPKTVVTALGVLRPERAYYVCGECGAGFCPRDRALGISDSHLSPGVLRMVGVVGASVSFAEGSGLLRELAGLEVTAKDVERGAEGLGDAIRRFEREVAEAAPEAPAATMYLAMDGTGVPMRKEELKGRKGKQEDGSSKTREAKLCAVWSAEGRDDEGHPVRDPGSVTYTGAIESAETKDAAKVLAPFAQRVEREARRRGFDRAKRQVVVADGAPWIWNLVDEIFPEAIQVLDRWHAKEHLSEVGKAVFGATSELAKAWTLRRWDELDEGDVDGLIAACREHAPRCEEARKCVGYLESNRERMDYPRFLSLGLCTGSGVMEAGCKTAAGVRLKRAGMHWTVRGANAILALRCCRLSGRFEDFWEWRAAA
ncbi:MAG: ISKra4 family transposase [Planctomycetes bacterium]|nr:ISKra4 family transposase [Planctomycetota bacterium]